MIYIVLAFLFLSIYFYLIFGGADFGVGILELLSHKKNRDRTKRVAYRVIGPVWEANHMWIILCIVILWICFPNYYYIMTTQLHIPLTLLLVGIIARGTSFVFRHYDAYEGKEHKIYDKVFQYSSVFATFFIGLNAGALLSGEMIGLDHAEGKTFYELYVNGWFNWFSALTGIFIVSLSGFISSIFLIGETEGETKKYYLRKAKVANIAVVLSGTLLFIESLVSDRLFGKLFFSNGWSLLGIAIVTLLIYPLWRYLGHAKTYISRGVLALQVLLMLLSWGVLAFPNIVFTANGSISIFDKIPEDSVFSTMGISLLIASVFVLPGLYHLFKTFGLIDKEEEKV